MRDILKDVSNNSGTSVQFYLFILISSANGVKTRWLETAHGNSRIYCQPFSFFLPFFFLFSSDSHLLSFPTLDSLTNTMVLSHGELIGYIALLSRAMQTVCHSRHENHIRYFWLTEKLNLPGTRSAVVFQTIYPCYILMTFGKIGLKLHEKEWLLSYKWAAGDTKFFYFVLAGKKIDFFFFISSFLLFSRFD